MKITQSNVSNWIDAILVIKNANQLTIAKSKLFGTNKLAVYQNNEISQYKEFDSNESIASTKEATGTLVGAGVGGLAFGGAGAIVGALAGGNKTIKSSKTSLAIEFNDGNWIVLEMNTNTDEFEGRCNMAVIKDIRNRCAEKAVSPF